jgi:dihydrofolate reductase
MMVSLDGFIEGPDKELDWHVWCEEMSEYMNNFFPTVDTIIFGRVAYQLMEGFWPTPAADTEDPTIKHYMNNLPKIVFSKTLSTVEWHNSRVVKDDIEKEIMELKHQPGKDMVIFGGADIASSIMKHNLIDEYRLVVNPVVLGSGNPLFQNIKDRLKLKLISTKTFSCGNVLLIYRPD